jgi:hypothetical protein
MKTGSPGRERSSNASATSCTGSGLPDADAPVEARRRVAAPGVRRRHAEDAGEGRRHQPRPRQPREGRRAQRPQHRKRGQPDEEVVRVEVAGPGDGERPGGEPQQPDARQQPFRPQAARRRPAPVAAARGAGGTSSPRRSRPAAPAKQGGEGGGDGLQRFPKAEPPERVAERRQEQAVQEHLQPAPQPIGQGEQGGGQPAQQGVGGGHAEEAPHRQRPAPQRGEREQGEGEAPFQRRHLLDGHRRAHQEAGGAELAPARRRPPVPQGARRRPGGHRHSRGQEGGEQDLRVGGQAPELHRFGDVEQAGADPQAPPTPGRPHQAEQRPAGRGGAQDAEQPAPRRRFPPKASRLNAIIAGAPTGCMFPHRDQGPVAAAQACACTR